MGQRVSRSANVDYDALRAEALTRPRDVFELGPTFTWEELKSAFRHVARHVHPDKGGSKELFGIATECFQRLAEEIARGEAEGAPLGHGELRKKHDVFVAMRPVVQTNDARHVMGGGVEMGGGFQDKFNKFFEDNRMDDDEVDHGYGGDMAESSPHREEIDIPRKLSKYDANQFHRLFEREAPVSKALIHRADPEPMLLAKRLQFTELGAGQPSDYSSDGATERTKNALQYADYLRAHTVTRLVHPKFHEGLVVFNSVEEYEAQRARRTEAALTDKEKRKIARDAKRGEQKETDRLARLNDRDRRVEGHHKRVTASAGRVLKL